jgi:hypothetical protein
MMALTTRSASGSLDRSYRIYPANDMTVCWTMPANAYERESDPAPPDAYPLTLFDCYSRELQQFLVLEGRTGPG